MPGLPVLTFVWQNVFTDEVSGSRPSWNLQGGHLAFFAARVPVRTDVFGIREASGGEVRRPQGNMDGDQAYLTLSAVL
jgi:hypothetical protein